MPRANVASVVVVVSPLLPLSPVLPSTRLKSESLSPPPQAAIKIDAVIGIILFNKCI